MIICLIFLMLYSCFLIPTASSYDIRFCTDFQKILKSFEQVCKVCADDAIKGILTAPRLPTETETFVISIRPGYENKTLFFALKVTHSRGRVSNVSNVVSTAIVFREPRPGIPDNGAQGYYSGTTTIALMVTFVCRVAFFV